MRYLPLIPLLAAFPAGAAELRNVMFEHVEDRYVLESEAWFAAGAEALYDVFLDYDLSPQFSSAIAEARSIEPGEDGRPRFYVKNRGCVLFFCKSFERYGVIDREPYTLIRATTDPATSDFEVSNESWAFRPDGDGTLVRYSIEFRPKFWVPPLIGPYVIRRMLIEKGAGAIDRIEALAQERAR